MNDIASSRKVSAHSDQPVLIRIAKSESWLVTLWSAVLFGKPR